MRTKRNISAKLVILINQLLILAVLITVFLTHARIVDSIADSGQRPDFIINQMPDPPTEKQSDWFRVFGWGDGLLGDEKFYWYVFSNSDGCLIFHADTFYLRDTALWCFRGFRVERKKSGTKLIFEHLWFERFCDYSEGSGWMCESNKTILEYLLNDFPIDLKMEIIETFEYK